ncbi:MAG: hypothetical protein OXE05_03175 [Chloroflexi bacterium]|nr:hypothetical protein [Chloroflexota bacterium]
MNTWKTNAPWRRQGVVTFRLELTYRIRQVYKMGLVYKIGFAVMVTGVIIMFSGGIFGGILFAALMQLLTLLGAPAEREFLPPNEPEAGEQMLLLLGALVFVCGACIVSIRLLLGLLGLASKPGWISKLGWVAKLGLGTAALGLLISIFGATPEFLLYEFFRYNYGQWGTMATLETIIVVGNVILWSGLALLVLGKPFRALLGSWVNWLGLGLIVIGIIGAEMGWGAPFIIAAVIGTVTLIVGVWRLLIAYTANP